MLTILAILGLLGAGFAAGMAWSQPTAPKRRKAIPKGTAAQRGPGRPRKPKAPQETPLLTTDEL